MNISCFKAYDIRGRIPDQLNVDVAYRVGRAYAQFLKPKTVVVGQDVRPTSPALTAALIKGLAEGGADVLDLGLCGTEEIYFATSHAGMDGGIGGLDDEAEDIMRHVIPLSEALEMVENGAANTAPLILSLQWLAMRKDQLA